MDYILPGIVILGVLLFVFGWLKVIIAGFSHHPVTGLVGMLPAVNLLVFPVVWHRCGKSIMASAIGLLLIAVAWFFGAETKINQLVGKVGMDVSETAKPNASSANRSSASLALPVAQVAANNTKLMENNGAEGAKGNTATAAEQASQPVVNDAANDVAIKPAAPTRTKKDLPDNALYHFVFADVDVTHLPEMGGAYVRIVQKDGRHREGKLLSSTESNLRLEERENNARNTRSIRLNDIRSATVMQREAEGKGD